MRLSELALYTVGTIEKNPYVVSVFKALHISLH